MDDKVLVTLKGKPIITAEDLAKEKEFWSQDVQLRESPEYLESEDFDRNCLEGLVRKKLLAEYVSSYKRHNSTEYQQRLDDAIAQLDRSILYETIDVSVSEDEMRALYAQWSPDRSYEEMKDELRYYLEKMKFKDCLDKRIEQLKKEYDVKVDESLLPRSS